MSKSKCNVAKDLMPLVIDGVASEESQQYVDDHIAECTECALTYGAMKVELPRISAEKERAEMEKAAKKVRRKRILRGIVGAVRSIAFFMACYVGVPKLLALHDETQFMDRYVCENGDLKLDALYYDVSQQPGDLRVQVDIHSFPSGNPYFHPETEAVVINNGTAICVQHRAVYDEEEFEYSSTGVMCWTGLIKDGKWVTQTMELRNEDGSVGELPIVRIELHAGDDYVVLWEEGDVLQMPSEAKIKREAEEAKYAAK